MAIISTVIGLGNIGHKYAGSRHNLGFEVINRIAAGWDMKPDPGDGEYYVVEKRSVHGPVRLIWPTTYMNNSGRAVARVMEKYAPDPSALLVVFDDLALPLGTLRLRLKGSDGGHNGMASVIYQLGTDEIPRLRLGIGPLPPEADQVSFVLGRFNEKEDEKAQKMLEKAAMAVLYSVEHRLEEAMNLYNYNPAPDDK